MPKPNPTAPPSAQTAAVARAGTPPVFVAVEGGGELVSNGPAWPLVPRSADPLARSVADGVMVLSVFVLVAPPSTVSPCAKVTGDSLARNPFGRENCPQSFSLSLLSKSKKGACDR